MRPPLRRIQEHILGKHYDLSVAFLSPKEMRKVTLRTKKKNKVSNVLAFPLSPNSGEILICKEAAAPFTISYLFIHGCLHLAGQRHGVTMEREERRVLKRFGLRANE